MSSKHAELQGSHSRDHIDPSKRKRKRHSKSRSGCSNCKKLRVKCDETQPRCQNCIRRNKECIYVLCASGTSSRAKKGLSDNDLEEADDLLPAIESASNSVASSTSTTTTFSSGDLMYVNSKPGSISALPTSKQRMVSFDGSDDMNDASPAIDAVLSRHHSTTNNSISAVSPHSHHQSLVAPDYASAYGQLDAAVLNYSLNPGIHDRGHNFNDTDPNNSAAVLHTVPITQFNTEAEDPSKISPNTVLSHETAASAEEDAAIPQHYDTVHVEHEPPLIVEHQRQMALGPSMLGLIQFRHVFSQVIPGNLFSTAPDVHVTFPEYELVHHYSHHALEFIMNNNDTDKRIWNEYVPRIGFGSGIVMDAILGVASFNLTRVSQGTRDYRAYSLKKFYYCLSRFHSDQEISAEDNFVVSCFLMMMAFEMPEVIPLADETRLDLIAVISGPSLVAESMYQVLGKQFGPLISYSHAFQNHILQTNPPMVLPVQYLLALAEKLDEAGLLGPGKLQLLTIDGESREPYYCESGSHCDIYLATIRQMQDCCRMAVQLNSAQVLLFFIMYSPPEYQSLLRKRYAFAMVIMTFLLTFFTPVSKYGWFRDRGVLEMNRLILELGHEWADVLSWPIYVKSRGFETITELVDVEDRLFPDIDVTKLADASSSARYVNSYSSIVGEFH